MQNNRHSENAITYEIILSKLIKNAHEYFEIDLCYSFWSRDSSIHRKVIFSTAIKSIDTANIKLTRNRT